MTWPLDESSAWIALLLGFGFGVALESAGFGSPRKLTAQFSLRDFAVAKVMFTAVIVAACGLWLAEIAGLLTPGEVFVPTLFAWSFLLGGALIGAGFAIGGYCPGTAAVGLASGRWDALVFILGMVAGIAVFSTFFEHLRSFYLAAEGPEGWTLDQLLGLPKWGILLIMAAAAALIFILGARLERRFNGPIEAHDIVSGGDRA